MISIVIPTYNREKFISRAIDSVLSQDYNNWELLVVDDGSTDHTEQVVEKYLEDQRIQYIRQKNTGATAARNRGAEKASGEYLTFLDSDDEAFPNWLSELYGEVKKGFEVVCCGYEYYDFKGNLMGVNLPYRMGGLYADRTGRFTNGGVFLLRRQLFLKAGGYDDKVKSGQHTEFAIRLFEILEKEDIEISNLFRPLIKVHVHQEQKIRNDNRALLDGTLYTLKKHKKLFEQQPIIYRDYLNVAAIAAIRLGKSSLGQKLLKKSYQLDPGNIKNLFRLVISYVPPIRQFLWNGKGSRQE